MRRKVLYIEDEPFIAQMVKDGLISSGYDARVVADGAKAMSIVQEYRPDICILDIMLPNFDGYELAAWIRTFDRYLPIIFLSAKSLTDDVVKGFKSGGNDYLRKPFSIDELLIRVDSLLQRFAGSAEGNTDHTKRVYNFGNSRLDAVQQILTTPEGNCTLSFKGSTLLELLIKHKNNVLERREALMMIWQDDSYYNTRSMDVFMAHLRKQLRSDPAVQIIGLRGVGYKLIC